MHLIHGNHYEIEEGTKSIQKAEVKSDPSLEQGFFFIFEVHGGVAGGLGDCDSI